MFRTILGLILIFVCIHLINFTHFIINENKALKVKQKEHEEIFDALGVGGITTPVVNEYSSGYKQFIEGRLFQHGLFNYHWSYSDVEFPFEDIDSVIVTSEYGHRTINRVYHFHYGIDLVSLYDYRILNTLEDATVDEVFRNNIYGLTVRISNKKYKATYSHLSICYVEPGQKLDNRQVIGITGNSGQSLGVHLHYSLSYKDKKGHWMSLNPLGNTTYVKFMDGSSNKDVY